MGVAEKYVDLVVNHIKNFIMDINYSNKFKFFYAVAKLYVL